MNDVDRSVVLSQRLERFAKKIDNLAIHWQAILFTEDHDLELAVWCWQQRAKTLPPVTVPDELLLVAMAPLMAVFKRELRELVVGTYQTQLSGMKAHLQASLADSATAATFRTMNVPAPEGTVAEIAAKYNVSKSEVRRLKQAGRLHELTLNGASHGPSDQVSNPPPS